MPFAEPSLFIPSPQGPYQMLKIYQPVRTFKEQHSENGGIEMVEKGVTWEKKLLPASVFGKISIGAYEERYRRAEAIWLGQKKVGAGRGRGGAVGLRGWGSGQKDRASAKKATYYEDEGVYQWSKKEIDAAEAMVAFATKPVVFPKGGQAKGRRQTGKPKAVVGPGTMESGVKPSDKKRKV